MKLDQLISKYGTYIANRNDCNYINKILEIANFEKIMQYKPQQLKRVIFVTPKMHTGMGGLTSVLRIAKRLESKGLEISFTCYESNDVKKMRQEAHNNLDSFDAIYITYDKAKLNNYDFVISTNWESVFFARYIKGHQIYFMQDYEPYFYPISEKYFLAKKSLELGASIISLGKRNVEQLRKNTNIKVLIVFLSLLSQANIHGLIETILLLKKKLI